VKRADPSSIQAYGVVRVVDYNQGAFTLLIEAVGDSSWYSLSDGELFQVSLFDETTAVVIENSGQMHAASESPGLGRCLTGLLALDRVLNGGLVEGSTTLLAGQPGTGKTTLTLQMLDGLGCRCLYATGEETREHVEARARRVGALSDRIHVLPERSLEEIFKETREHNEARRVGALLDRVHVLAERRLEEIFKQAQSMHAQVLAIDTIQMLCCEHVRGRPGLPAQLRVCASRLIDYARTTGTTLWLVGHVTASDDIAGPKSFVDVFDVVLRLDQEDDARILSCHKNKFGPTNVVERLKLTAEGFWSHDSPLATEG